MSAGKYLVSLKFINTSDKISKFKCLVQKSSNIEYEVKCLEDYKTEATKLVKDYN